MRKLVILAFVAATAVAFAVPAAATIVNVDGVNNASTDGHNAASLSLGSGTYKVTFTQGDYTAFNRWSSSSGCDQAGANCRQGWEDSAVIAIGSSNSPVFYFGDGDAHGGYGPVSGGGYFDTAADAFAHAATYSQIFTLSAPASVFFSIFDDYLGDNSGGVSLSVVAVPEPAGWPMLLVGFGLLGAFALRRRKTAARNAA